MNLWPYYIIANSIIINISIPTRSPSNTVSVTDAPRAIPEHYSLLLGHTQAATSSMVTSNKLTFASSKPQTTIANTLSYQRLLTCTEDFLMGKELGGVSVVESGSIT